MMEWLLARFRAVIELRATLARTEEDRRSLQAEVVALQRENERLMAMLDKAAEGERQAYQLMVNVHHQTKYGYVPYPQAPHLTGNVPPLPESGPLDDGTARLREIQENEINEAFEQFQALFVPREASS